MVNPPLMLEASAIQNPQRQLIGRAGQPDRYAFVVMAVGGSAATAWTTSRCGLAKPDSDGCRRPTARRIEGERHAASIGGRGNPKTSPGRIPWALLDFDGLAGFQPGSRNRLADEQFVALLAEEHVAEQAQLLGARDVCGSVWALSPVRMAVHSTPA